MNTLQPTIDVLVSTLRNNPDLPVIFMQNEQTISPGYHITEVKVADVRSMDCGRGSDQWREVVIQLLDGNAESSGTYMHSAKLMGILHQALNSEHTDNNTQLYFEFTPGNTALHKSGVSSFNVVNDTITITLTATTAQCKPYQRALAGGKESNSASACCSSTPVPSDACCNSARSDIDSPCCN